jgi:hypothetical protein
MNGNWGSKLPFTVDWGLQWQAAGRVDRSLMPG